MLRIGHAKVVALVVSLIAGLPDPVFAADGRTPDGRISVALVAGQLEAAGSDAAAGRLLTAYIAGVIESALAMNDRATAQGRPVFCKKGEGNLDGPTLLALFRKAAPDPSTWADTAATPIIVQHLVSLYPCP